MDGPAWADGTPTETDYRASTCKRRSTPTRCRSTTIPAEWTTLSARYPCECSRFRTLSRLPVCAGNRKRRSHRRWCVKRLTWEASAAGRSRRAPGCPPTCPRIRCGRGSAARRPAYRFAPDKRARNRSPRPVAVGTVPERSLRPPRCSSSRAAVPRNEALIQSGLTYPAIFAAASAVDSAANATNATMK